MTPTFFTWLRHLEDDKSVRVDMLSFLVHMASMCQQKADNSKDIMVVLQGFLHVFTNCLLEKVSLVSLKSANFEGCNLLRILIYQIGPCANGSKYLHLLFIFFR